VPFTLSGDGLPVGIQFIAPAPRTQDLLSLAYQFQTHWRGLDLWPPHAA
jgi:Asp-tRNA(Asn)/Glu-tRNA(Gln) amidotransferase A subunit family amidase